MNELHEFLKTITPGPVQETEKLEQLLAVQWQALTGADEGGMDPDKLLGRMENVIWEPPVLKFFIERPGGTVCGSTRAEVQHWLVDLNDLTAQITETTHRQLEPMAPRLSVTPLAGEIAGQILRGEEDWRLSWVDNNTVHVVVSRIFPSGDGFKRTIEGRRRRLRDALSKILEQHGWTHQGSNVFSRGKVD